MSNKHNHFCKKHKQTMKWILNFFFQTKKLVIHLTEDFHVMIVHTKPTNKANAAIHMASSLPAIVVAHPVDGAIILF